jgi:hypothetical protein
MHEARQARSEGDHVRDAAPMEKSQMAQLDVAVAVDGPFYFVCGGRRPSAARAMAKIPVSRCVSSALLPLIQRSWMGWAGLGLGWAGLGWAGLV